MADSKHKGLKYVIQVTKIGSQETLPYSTYKLVCAAIGINYFSFNKWKKAFPKNGPIILAGFVIKRELVIREIER